MIREDVKTEHYLCHFEVPEYAGKVLSVRVRQGLVILILHYLEREWSRAPNRYGFVAQGCPTSRIVLRAFPKRSVRQLSRLCANPPFVSYLDRP